MPITVILHLWLLLHQLVSLPDSEKSSVMVLSISKAFVRVHHKSMISQLTAFGYPILLCKLIFCFLINWSVDVIVDGSIFLSFSFSINSGDPQGSVLSSFFFSLWTIFFRPVRSYADDSTLHSSTSFIHQSSSIARSLYRWVKLNLVNSSDFKTKFLPPFHSKVTLDFGDFVVQSLNSRNMLGVSVILIFLGSTTSL